MTDTIRVLVIDQGQVTEQQMPNTLQGFYDLIGCDCIDGAGYLKAADGTVHAVWVDDEGLLYDADIQFHHVTWYPQALAGRIVVTGFDDEGETLPSTMSVEELRSHVLGHAISPKRD